MASPIRHDAQGFLIGQRRLESGIGAVYVDTQEILRILRGDLSLCAGEGQSPAGAPPSGPHRRTMQPPARQAAPQGSQQQARAIDRLAQAVASTPTMVLNQHGLRPASRAGASQPAQAQTHTLRHSAVPLPGSGGLQRQRDARGRFTGPGNEQQTRTIRTPEDALAEARRQRDARGRFTGGGRSQTEQDNEERGFIGRLADAIGERVGEANAQVPDSLDPIVDSFNEARQMLAPVGRVAGRLFGSREDREQRRQRRKERQQERVQRRMERHAQRQEQLQAQTNRLLRGRLGGAGGDGMIYKILMIVAMVDALVSVIKKALKKLVDLLPDGVKKFLGMGDDDTTTKPVDVPKDKIPEVARQNRQRNAASYQQALKDAQAQAHGGLVENRPVTLESKPVENMGWSEKMLTLRAALGSQDARDELAARYPDNPAGYAGGNVPSSYSWLKQQSAGSRNSGLMALLNQYEGGGNYDTLFGHAQRPGGAFAGTQVSNMNMGEALRFSDTRGDYARWVASRNKGVVATPMGAGQIVHSTLARLVRQLGIPLTAKFDAAMQQRLIEQLARERLQRAKTPGAKREAIRSEWPGLKRASDAQLDAAIAQLEGQQAKSTALPTDAQGLAAVAQAGLSPDWYNNLKVLPSKPTQQAAPVMPQPMPPYKPKPAPQPPKPERQVSSNNNPQPVTVIPSADTISQNVGDRMIAHAVTGGLGMGRWDDSAG